MLVSWSVPPRPLLRRERAYLYGCRWQNPRVRVFADSSVPPEQRDLVKESVAAMLLPILGRHPQFESLAAVVSYGAKGWDVTVVTLDRAFGLDGEPDPGIGGDLLEAVKEALRHAARR